MEYKVGYILGWIYFGPFSGHKGKHSQTLYNQLIAPQNLGKTLENLFYKIIFRIIIPKYIRLNIFWVVFAAHAKTPQKPIYTTHCDKNKAIKQIYKNK